MMPLPFTPPETLTGQVDADSEANVNVTQVTGPVPSLRGASAPVSVHVAPSTTSVARSRFGADSSTR